MDAIAAPGPGGAPSIPIRCPGCGSPVPADTPKCPWCGRNVNQGGWDDDRG
jgi:hypothetical protein